MPRTIRVITVGFLLFALASSTLQALPSISGSRGGTRVESGDYVAAVWKWLVLVFSPNPEPTGQGSPEALPKEGSQLDPDGNH